MSSIHVLIMLSVQIRVTAQVHNIDVVMNWKLLDALLLLTNVRNEKVHCMLYTSLLYEKLHSKYFTNTVSHTLFSKLSMFWGLHCFLITLQQEDRHTHTLTHTTHTTHTHTHTHVHVHTRARNYQLGYTCTFIHHAIPRGGCVFTKATHLMRNTRALYMASIYTAWMDRPCHLWQTLHLTQRSTAKWSTLSNNTQHTTTLLLCTHLYIHAGSYMYMYMYGYVTCTYMCNYGAHAQ